jgi:hypothetical protein
MIAADMQRRLSADTADIATAIGDRLRTRAIVPAPAEMPLGLTGTDG